MIKRVGLLKKRNDLTTAEYVRHWTEVHTRLALEMPGLRRYVINVVDRALSPDAPIDGFSELWFDDLDSMRTNFADPAGHRQREDVKLFWQEVHVMIVDESGGDIDGNGR